MGKIRVKVGPKAYKMFATFITSAALYEGPAELEKKVKQNKFISR